MFPTSFKKTGEFKIKENPEFGLNTLDKMWWSKLTKSVMGQPCVICEEAAVESHHVRKIRELKQRKHLDWFTMQMAAINRKQVPLCKVHHQKLHAGQLSHEERQLYHDGVREYGRRPSR